MKRTVLGVLARAAAWRGRESAARAEARRLAENLPPEVAEEAARRRSAYLDWTVRRRDDDAAPAQGRGRARRGETQPARAASSAGPDKVRVAAVQMRMRAEPHPAAFAGHVFDLFLRAARAGADVVAFPEDAGTGLVALLPGFGWLQRAGTPEKAARGGGDLSVAEVFALLGPAVEATYRTIFSTFAEAFGVFVLAGTANLPASDGRVQNLAHVFAPDGRLVVRQPKLHLFPYEAGWGLAAGGELYAWDTPWCRMTAPVCMDATYFETARIARGLGADVVLLPIANPEPFHLWKARRGVWGRCQEGGFYAVQSALVGRFMGLEIEGQSGIFAPLDLTPGGDGVLAEAARPDEEDVVVADLDLAALRAWREAQPEIVAPGWWRSIPQAYGLEPVPEERRTVSP